MSEGTPINAPAPDTETSTETTPETPEPAATDDAAEVAKWKAQARKHEERAKANANAAKELERLKLESLDETGKAVEAAKAEGRAAALTEMGGKLVAAEFKVAAGGRIDVDTLLEGLDRSKFLNEDGDPDTDAITAWVQAIAPAQTEPAATADGFPAMPDLGQGSRQPAVPLNGDPLLNDLKSKLGIA